MGGLQTLIAALLYSQAKRKPRLRPLDRAFWSVVRWHRKGFRLYWRWISKRGPGRPRISAEVQELIPRFAAENAWGARKIHAELEKLGFTVGLATVSRYLAKRPPVRQKPQSWRTVLRNHRDGIVAMVVGLLRVGGLHHRYVWHEAA